MTTEIHSETLDRVRFLNWRSLSSNSPRKSGRSHGRGGEMILIVWVSNNGGHQYNTTQWIKKSGFTWAQRLRQQARACISLHQDLCMYVIVVSLVFLLDSEQWEQVSSTPFLSIRTFSFIWVVKSTLHKRASALSYYVFVSLSSLGDLNFIEKEKEGEWIWRRQEVMEGDYRSGRMENLDQNVLYEKRINFN